MTRRDQFAAAMLKPQTVPIIFLHLAKVYRDNLQSRTDKRRRRDGLILALNKIIDAKQTQKSAPQSARARIAQSLSKTWHDLIHAKK